MNHAHPSLQNAPRLRFVLGSLARAFRPHRPHAADPESRRNQFNAMCCVCDWQREYETSQGASDKAMTHGRTAHGDAFMGFVRIQARPAGACGVDETDPDC